ncbi:MAG: leucine-rich repeat protein [Bacteroidota bacterium]
MKKNDWILLLSVAMYSWMFYHQSAGINFLLFGVALIAMLLIRDRTLLRDSSWYTSASAVIVSGVCVTLYGTPVSIAANIVSLGLMSAFSISRGSSVFLAGLYAMYSFITSVGFMIADAIMRKSDKTPTGKSSKFWVRLTIGLGIFIVVLVFFLLYQNANPLFHDLTRKIKLDFLSWEWVRFTLLGLLLVYGFLYHRNFPGWYRKDTATPNSMDREAVTAKGSRLFGRSINPGTEAGSGVVLIALLNVLLLIVNSLDVVYMWITKQLPDGMTYADYVHQGAGTLIVAILLAIFVMLFYFRGFLNFYEKSRPLKILVYLWIAQNAFVVISTAYRNLLYINEYYLTYKRIGVFVWLLLTLIGLATVAIKVAQHKGNWYLWRKNGWAFFGVLILFACFNWDLVITRFNINKSEKLDKYYLVDMMSPANIPYLLALPSDERDFEPVIEDTYVDSYDYDHSYYGDYTDKKGNYTAQLHERMFDFLKRWDRKKWKSWCWADKNAADKIYAMSDDGSLKKLLLRGISIDSLAPLARLRNVEYMDLSSNSIHNFEDLGNFDKLQVLYLSNNGIYTLDGLPKMRALKELHLNNNNVRDFKPVNILKDLELLDIANNSDNVDLKPLAGFKKLTELNIASNEIHDYSTIGKLTSLKKLNISAQKNKDFTSLPVLGNLEEMDISNNSLSSSDAILITKFKDFKNLKKLNIANNSLHSLYILTNYYQSVVSFWGAKEPEVIKPLFEKIEDLNIASNTIYELEPLRYFGGLKSLDISENTVNTIEPLNRLTMLQRLDAANIGVQNIDSLKPMTNLKYINLTGNTLASIKVLFAFMNLEEIKVTGNRITDIRGISALKNLRYLNISANQIFDISELAKMQQLERLDISNNPISDYSPLYGLKGLKELQVSDISKDDLGKLKDQLPNTLVSARNVQGKFRF